MGPKPTPSKKTNTLFSYFNKSPVVKQTSTPKSNNNDVLSPKRSPNSKSLSPGTASKQTADVGNASGSDYTIGDLTWAKLEGYPWWPALVCGHPTDNTHFKGGKKPQVHVQFFDDPVSRAWVKAKYIHPYKGSSDKDFQRGGQFFSHNPKVREGVQQADKAVKLTNEERLKLVVELQPSEDEDESMDLDPDIFDDEMDEEPDNSKENVSMTEAQQDEKKQTPSKSSKSPRKTPKKDSDRRKSSRPPKPKRRRIIENAESEEESGDEFKLKSDAEKSSSEDDVSSGVDEDDVSDIESASEPESPIKAPQKRKRPPPKPAAKPSVSPDTTSTLNSFGASNKSASFTPTLGEKTKSKLAMFTAADGPSTSSSAVTEQEANFPHLKLDFLQPHKIRDDKMRLRTDPDYNPRTVHIPESFRKNTTPAIRQWWDLKSQYYDTILFFKMGKFYELFHMDAVVSVNELGLIYMKGEQAHSGFPEIAYNRYAETLIQKGYKVVRVEQTETPDMMNERLKASTKQTTKFDKVVRREVCRVTTKATQTFSFMDGDCSEAQNSFLLAIAEKEENTEGRSKYGVCFVDTSIGKFYVGQFTDDRHCSRLRTLIAHYTPSQVLFEKNKMTQKTQLVLKNNLTSVSKEGLASGSEFWDSSKTLKRLAEEDYFKEDEEEFTWPATIKKMISETDALGLTAADEYTLAVAALGAVTWYLQYSLLDQELLSMKNFEEYSPLDNTGVKECRTEAFGRRQHMVLDGVTLANLDITENSSTGTLEGTLLEQLDHCNTPFGHRLFRQWLCAPLCNPVAINDRLDAVDDLMGAGDLVATTTEILKKLPDLERLLNRIHSLGSAARSKNHPDSRAIMFDEAKYSKKKIEDFLLTIEGFKSMSKVAKKFQQHVENFKSKLLTKTMTIQSGDNGGHFPDLQDDLEFFEHSFDHNKAKKDGVIVPNKGVDPDYDHAMADIQATERSLNLYLDRQRTRLGCKAMTFWGTAKNRYQMEVPESMLKKVPDDYELFSSKKGWKRYRTSEIDDMLAELGDSEDRKDAALKDTMRRIFHSYDDRYKVWEVALQCISVLDVLVSLSAYSSCGDGTMCRPEVVSPDGDIKPFLEIREGRHPCIAKTFSGCDFIPNDTLIGLADENEMETDAEENADSKIILVTGPNMGGKSTLMRQVGLITVIAQLGCYVPAEKCRMTPVDRVFTRLGASDRIMAGESTFFVELSETSAILQHATGHSLVLMDELGRGTATYDGTAIACSVVEELSRRVCCRTLFSTHYHSLVEEFSHDPNIRLGHMACMVENEDETDPTQETITFLYKLSRGACPKSYGFNAAKLANIPDEIIRVAVKKSKEFEANMESLRIIRALYQDCSVEKLGSLQQQIRDV